MGEILRGKSIVDKIKNQIREDVELLNKSGKIPTIGIVRVGRNPDDIYYENSIIRNCEELAIGYRVVEVGEAIDTAGLVGEIDKLNQDIYISGILIFRPLPSHIDEELIRRSVSPAKDIDCMHPENLGKIFEGDMSGFAPCTPKAAMEILKEYGVILEGKNTVVINRSMVVGKPLAMMLLEENATVTICHSRSRNLNEITRNADIILSGIGKANIFDESYFSDKSIIIDIGMGLNENNNISGDVNFEKVHKKVAAITPVPGGVGSITTSILLQQLVDGCKKGSF